MANTIEEYRNFSIHVLKRLGMLHDGFNGSMNWTQNGETVSTIGIYIYLSGNAPTMVLHYNITHTKEAVQDLVKLHHQKSNLPGHTGGYWMFICPVTGNPCRVLYLHNGHFVSRKALPKGVIYKCQTYAGCYRTIGRIFDSEEAIENLYKALLKPYGKEFYRGKPTRKARRLIKEENRHNSMLKAWSLPRRWRK